MQRLFLAGRSAGLLAQAAGLGSALRAKIGSSESVKTYQIKMSSLKVGHFYLKLYDKFVKITEVIHMPR